MTPSDKGIDLIKLFEECRLKAYQDAVGVWTIGWGCIMYRDGRKVAEGDTITQQQADDLLRWQVGLKMVGVNKLLGPYNVTQSQFDALVCFAYNVGIGGLETSTLLKKLKANSVDPEIRGEFLKWNKGRVNGKLVELQGLTRRRIAEADLYFS